MGCGCGKGKVREYVVTDEGGECLLKDDAGECVVFAKVAAASQAGHAAGLTGSWQVRPL